MDSRRLAGVGALAGGLLWSAAVAVQYGFSYQKPSSGTGYYVLQVVFMVAFLGWLVGVEGLHRSRLVGSGRFGRWSLRVFQLGLALMVVGTIAQTATGNEDIVLYPFGALAIVVAGLLTGIAVVRAGVWTGWQRFTPLLVILYFVFGMLVPSFAGSSNDGPPPALAIVWGATWMIFGLAYLVASGRRTAIPSAGPELTKARS